MHATTDPFALAPSLRAPWPDSLLYPIHDARARCGMAARALAAATPNAGPFRETMVRRDAAWIGDEAGAVLYEDGTALVGTREEGCVQAAPQVLAWRGPSGEDPRSWLGGRDRRDRSGRVAQLAWWAGDASLWRRTADVEESWRRIKDGKAALTPWAAVAVPRGGVEDEALHALVWAIARLAGVDTAALYGTGWDHDRLGPPCFLADGLSPERRGMVGKALEDGLRSILGPFWRWKTIAQHHRGDGGRPGCVAVLRAPASAHRALCALDRFAPLSVRFQKLPGFLS